MKKVLVTGCSGYIGQHLCAWLKGDQNGYEVWGIDKVYPSETALKYIDEFRYLDIRNENDLIAEYFECLTDCDEDTQTCRKVCRKILAA